MREDPIFITGCYRSGTTFLSRILDAHPDLNISYDTVSYFRFIIKKNMDPQNYEPILDEIGQRLKNRYNMNISKEEIVKKIEQFRPLTHKILYSAVMEVFFKTDQKRWGEKTLLEWSNLPFFLSMYPQGQVIHIIRDPRDVVASYKHMTIETGDKYLDAIFATMHSMDSAIIYKRKLPSDRYYLLKYEDLIMNPEKKVEEICKFLNIRFTLEMLNPNNYKDQFGKSFDGKRHSSFVKEDQLLDKIVPIDRWKKKLNKFEISFTEGFLFGQMQYFNYTFSDYFQDNLFYQLLISIEKTSLLKERIIHFLNTGEGIESYPSDPTLPQNWGD